MKQTMRRRLAFLSAILFVAGVIVVPAVHRLHHCDRDEYGKTHSPDDCSICRLSSTPLTTTHSHPAIELEWPLVQVPITPVLVITNPFIPQNTLARAPPRCA